MNENARDPREVAEEGEQLAVWLDYYAGGKKSEVFTKLRRAAAFIREGYPMPVTPVLGAPAPDPLEQAEQVRQPLRQCFVLPTEGRDPGIDAVAVICAVLGPLAEEERQACLAYVTSRYAGPA